MVIRIISSAFLLPLLILLFFTPTPLYFFWFLVAVLGLSFMEFRAMLRPKGLDVSLWGGVLAFVLLGSALMPAASCGLPALDVLFLAVSRWGFPVVAAVLVLGLCGREVLRYRENSSLLSIWATLFVICYLGGLGNLAMRLRLEPFGSWWTFLLFFFSWMYDAGAYFVGKAMGRHPLSPISPSKTVEGMAGGMAVSAL